MGRKIFQEKNDRKEGFWVRVSQRARLLSGWSSEMGFCISKARTLDIWIQMRMRRHQGFPLIIRALHTPLIQIKGIHIRFHISLVILYMAVHVHLDSKLHPYISSFLWSLLLHLLFWNISNYLAAQLFVKWSVSLCRKGIFKKKRFIIIIVLYADFKDLTI